MLKFKKNCLKVGFLTTGDPLGFYSESEMALKTILSGKGADLTTYYPSVNDERSALAAIRFFEEKEIDVILYQVCNFCGLGNVAKCFAESRFTLLLWCVSEPLTSGYLNLNSMTSMNLFTSVFFDTLGCDKTKVKWLYGNITDLMFIERLSVSVDALRTMKTIKGANIARFGGTVPGFVNLNFSHEGLKHRWGVSINDYEVGDIYPYMEAADDTEVQKLCCQYRVQFTVSNEVTDAQLETAVRLILGIKTFFIKNRYSATAFMCWPKIQQDKGISTCFSQAMLNDMGIITACEGDAIGALTMLIANALSGKASMIMDMVGMNIELDTMTFWHCGLGMPSFANKNGILLTKLRSKAFEQPGVVSNIKFKPQEVTILRLNGMNADKIFCAEAEIVDGPDESFYGSGGYFTNITMQGEPMSVKDFFNTVCVSGNAHHYVIVPGRVEKQVLEFANRMGLDIIQPIKYTDYI